MQICMKSEIRVALFLCLLSFYGSTNAAQWNPLCVEGSSCSAPYNVSLGGGYYGYHPIDRHAAGPLVGSNQIFLHHRPIDYSESCTDCDLTREVFSLSAGGKDVFEGRIYNVSDANSIELESGKKLTFGLKYVSAWSDPEEDVETYEWHGGNTLSLNNAALTGPPVQLSDRLYIAKRGSASQSVHESTDDGVTWTVFRSSIRIGDDRYNLMPNPEQDALWAIKSEFGDEPGSLWESINGGKDWVQVDDGSFPLNTVRVVPDPANVMASYALTDHGLFVSFNRGVSWQETSLPDAVHGLVFIDRDPPLSRVLIVGTDTGVKVSKDEGLSWVDMSNGLLAQPYTVTYGHGQLIATSDSGYFTCNSIDCAGQPQDMPAEEERGLVDVVEFYNTQLDHYFITGTEIEAGMIDEGLAGPGWVRTGESFRAWSLGGNINAVDVCRFYGSMDPGPNSHFYSVSPNECRFLLDLQVLLPNDEPRWNFEGYAFSILPPSSDEQAPCPETTAPVYRAYNDAFRHGEDSNHRYVTDLALLDEMVVKGWINEGIAFCSVAEEAVYR